VWFRNIECKNWVAFVMNKIASYLDFHAQALKLRSRRNEVLASNIANAATPNFKARDLDFDAEIKRHAGGLGPLTTTDSQHIESQISPVRDRLMFRDPINPSLDGNTVELAVEQMEFSENVVRYQTTLGFLNSRISGLMSAIRGE
jgi:flagellar basal-body rod protein FlgB